MMAREAGGKPGRCAAVDSMITGLTLVQHERQILLYFEITCHCSLICVLPVGDQGKKREGETTGNGC